MEPPDMPTKFEPIDINTSQSHIYTDLQKAMPSASFPGMLQSGGPLTHPSVNNGANDPSNDMMEEYHAL